MSTQRTKGREGLLCRKRSVHGWCMALRKLESCLHKFSTCMVNLLRYVLFATTVSDSYNVGYFRVGVRAKFHSYD